MIHLKRAYEKSSDEDGVRILVERLWPRGLTKARAAVNLWMKDVAPSPDLRKWFGHDPARWKQFKQRYWKELKPGEKCLTSSPCAGAPKVPIVLRSTALPSVRLRRRLRLSSIMPQISQTARVSRDLVAKSSRRK